jgi:D-3-phosphoglycerate dehydrogenase/C-terminal binding protein
MPDRPRVYITDFIADDDPLEAERQVLGELVDVVALAAEGEAALAGRVDDAACLMVYHFVTVGPATLERLGGCRLIVRCGVGYDNVDTGAALERGIPVCNVPDYGTEEVADSAIGMMLSLARGTHLLNSRLRRRRGPWIYTQAVPLHRLRGRTFGVIGLGRIGTAAAHRAKAMGMEVVFYDPYVADGSPASRRSRSCWPAATWSASTARPPTRRSA